MCSKEELAAFLQKYAAGCRINAEADASSVNAKGLTDSQRAHRKLQAVASQELAAMWYKYARVSLGVE